VLMYKDGCVNRDVDKQINRKIAVADYPVRIVVR
jgi:hypothetical protein